MPLILAIEPDPRQSTRLADLVRRRLSADLVHATTTEGALTALARVGDRVPDLVLVPSLLSAQEDAAIAGALRVIAAAANVRMLTIPMFADPEPPAKPQGVLARLRSKKPKVAPVGCDPEVFADQIATYLAEAAAERNAQREELELLHAERAASRAPAVVSHQVPARPSVPVTIDEPLPPTPEPAPAITQVYAPLIIKPVIAQVQPGADGPLILPPRKEPRAGDAWGSRGAEPVREVVPAAEIFVTAAAEISAPLEPIAPPAETVFAAAALATTSEPPATPEHIVPAADTFAALDRATLAPAEAIDQIIAAPVLPTPAVETPMEVIAAAIDNVVGRHTSDAFSTPRPVASVDISSSDAADVSLSAGEVQPIELFASEADLTSVAEPAPLVESAPKTTAAEAVIMFAAEPEVAGAPRTFEPSLVASSAASPAQAAESSSDSTASEAVLTSSSTPASSDVAAPAARVAAEPLPDEDVKKRFWGSRIRLPKFVQKSVTPRHADNVERSTIDSRIVEPVREPHRLIAPDPIAVPSSASSKPAPAREMIETPAAAPIAESPVAVAPSAAPLADSPEVSELEPAAAPIATHPVLDADPSKTPDVTSTADLMLAALLAAPFDEPANAPAVAAHVDTPAFNAVEVQSTSTRADNTVTTSDAAPEFFPAPGPEAVAPSSAPASTFEFVSEVSVETTDAPTAVAPAAGVPVFEAIPELPAHTVEAARPAEDTTKAPAARSRVRKPKATRKVQAKPKPEPREREDIDEVIDIDALLAPLLSDMAAKRSSSNTPPEPTRDAVLESQPPVASARAASESNVAPLGPPPPAITTPVIASADEVDPMFFADDALVVPPPTPAQAERSAWLELVESLRQDIERLKAEREQVVAAPVSPAQAQDPAPPPPPSPHPRRPATASQPNPSVAPVRPRAKTPRPIEDQWGLFDPEQCGFAALLAKLDEIGARDDVSA